MILVLILLKMIKIMLLNEPKNHLRQRKKLGKRKVKLKPNYKFFKIPIIPIKHN